MTANATQNGNAGIKTLYLAFELGDTGWKLAFSTGMAQKPRLRSMNARDLPVLQMEIAKAKKRFGLSPEAPVKSCYEAGHDGFWLHRYLCSCGVANSVIDSASIEVNRRLRRAKTDRIVDPDPRWLGPVGERYARFRTLAEDKPPRVT